MALVKSKQSHPAWSYSTNIYEVNIRQYTPEGTFSAFAKHLPRLHDMGVQVLWFMPVTIISQKNRLGTLGSYYAAQDYRQINPEFGSEEDFKALVEQAHQMKFKVLIDFVADHTGNDHIWLSEYPQYYVRGENNDFSHPHGWSDVSELNYAEHGVWDQMVDVLNFWIEKYDVDGFRCDMAHLVPLDFWKYAYQKTAEVKKGLFWLAECEEPDYHQVFDATYTWRWMHASEEFYHKKMNLQSLLTVLYKSVTEFPCNAFRLYFTSNHDENSWNGTEYEKYGDAVQLLGVFSCTWNGIPLIYSGQELPNKKRLPFFEKDNIEWDNKIALHSFYKTLLSLKAENKALRAGDPNVLTKIVSHPDDHQIFAYLRKHNLDQVLVVLNFSNQEHNFLVKNVTGKFRNVFGGPDITFPSQVYVQAWGYLLFERIEMLSDK